MRKIEFTNLKTSEHLLLWNVLLQKYHLPKPRYSLNNHSQVLLRSLYQEFDLWDRYKSTSTHLQKINNAICTKEKRKGKTTCLIEIPNIFRITLIAKRRDTTLSIELGNNLVLDAENAGFINSLRLSAYQSEYIDEVTKLTIQKLISGEKIISMDTNPIASNESINASDPNQYTYNATWDYE